ncbi:MerR family transcriptional regulator [Micromonospora okii]|uniref:MerR family transcriptional regulator n=1 Tax=Micromonospora okii TaxID=1182970 RepID=UPI001E28A140|nr:MerR family transcriptional regulator [Micromonospora okii]
MRIGELARITGCTPRSLRHYEAQGLIAAERAVNGYRDYDERAATRVRNIRRLLDAGLTLDDVRLFLPCLDGDVAAAAPSPAGVRVGLQRLAVLESRIAAQVAVRDRLAAALHDAAAACVVDLEHPVGLGLVAVPGQPDPRKDQA